MAYPNQGIFHQEGSRSVALVLHTENRKGMC